MQTYLFTLFKISENDKSKLLTIVKHFMKFTIVKCYIKLSNHDKIKSN